MVAVGGVPVLAGGLAVARAWPARSQATAGSQPVGADAYAPLELYNGSWDSKTIGAKPASPVHLTNHCAKTGVFFACEQVVDGKSEDLVVFLPTGATAGTQHYRTQALSAGADKPGDWGELAITGDRWVYSGHGSDKGVTTYWRTINKFSGPDRIHFETQRSKDGQTWETTQQGDEQRGSRTGDGH
jgi:hypothetical protein